MESKPFFKQIWVGSGVPGNGLSTLHLAHAQSLLGILVVAPMTPSMLSDACVVSAACVVSRLNGLYGTGLPWTNICCELGPLTLTMRPMTGPVTGEPSGFFATGTTT